MSSEGMMGYYIGKSAAQHNHVRELEAALTRLREEKKELLELLKLSFNAMQIADPYLRSASYTELSKPPFKEGRDIKSACILNNALADVQAALAKHNKGSE